MPVPSRPRRVAPGTGARAILRCVALGLGIALAGCGPGQTSTARPPSGSSANPIVGSATPAGSPSSSGTPSPSGSGSPTASAGTPGSLEPGSFDPATVAISLAPFVEGLAAPLAIVNAGDGSDRLFVAEQGGRIRIVRSRSLVSQPFLDIADRITTGGERGLLGIAFHPGFPADPRLFVDYTDLNGDTQVSSFDVDPTKPDRIDPTTERKLLFVKQPYANHNGGALLFDPDGFLLVSLGDGGNGGDPQGNGQSLATLLGKILRIDVDHAPVGRPYAIPADNPFASATDGQRPEIWLTGLRNPWRMSMDRATGDLWIGDVGQDRWEEIDVQRATDPGGTNFGWNRMEGNHCYLPRTDCQDALLTLPVTDYGHDQGCTVIGGAVYRGADQPALRGGYVFADYCSGRFWAIDPAVGGHRAPVVVGESGVNPSAFGEDEAGELYVADIGGGRILKVTATAR